MALYWTHQKDLRLLSTLRKSGSMRAAGRKLGVSDATAARRVQTLRELVAQIEQEYPSKSGRN
jgi:molybdate transport repressor ModE-like protein